MKQIKDTNKEEFFKLFNSGKLSVKSERQLLSEGWKLLGYNWLAKDGVPVDIPLQYLRNSHESDALVDSLTKEGLFEVLTPTLGVIFLPKEILDYAVNIPEEPINYYCDTENGIREIKHIIDSLKGKEFLYKQGDVYKIASEEDICPYFSKNSVIALKNDVILLVIDIKPKEFVGMSLDGIITNFKCRDVRAVLPYDLETFINSLFANTVCALTKNNQLIAIEENKKYLYIKDDKVKILQFRFTADNILDQNNNIVKLISFREADLFKSLEDVLA